MGLTLIGKAQDYIITARIEYNKLKGDILYMENEYITYYEKGSNLQKKINILSKVLR